MNSSHPKLLLQIPLSDDEMGEMEDPEIIDTKEYEE